MARVCKVKVASFSIGFGPEIIGFNDYSGTRWKLSMIPFGGYVKMLDDFNLMNTYHREYNTDNQLYLFNVKNRYQKAAIVFAGPCANMIFSVLLFTIFFSLSGNYITPPVINTIVIDSPAEKAGLLPGDTILQINKSQIKYFEDITRMITFYPNAYMEIKYRRGHDQYTTILNPSTVIDRDIIGNKIERTTIGITSVNIDSIKQYSVLKSVILSIRQTYYTMSLTIQSLVQIITGNGNINEIGGPIKIVQYSVQSAKLGGLTVIYFMAILSANLAIINIFPIPMLDGGHLFHYILEILIRRELNRKYQKFASYCGAYLLFLLMIIAIVNDIRHLL
ncbi:RIP metalloprotease RseP [Wolbachia endosymbiont of Howardula sp.]|uniref:RIP metalloprotease RseP n=1 Tax=Wolbachia endosymbiont of Howardula sp. TaxID=2916816 RepID=UPI00217EE7B7|nr:RIP metalloprotease RseP [Wolbachia endosymbiont of Howardula sp.]UWI83246.1 RIP metalloprotease RseP [Wolbachia endosymbiont of Howardula sp.]